MTVNPSRVKRYLFFTTCLFFKGLIASSIVMASNEVLKIDAGQGQGNASIEFSLKERPSYNLYAVNASHFLLTFHDTIKSASFENGIPDGDIFSVTEVSKPVSLKVDINLKRSFSRIETSWLEDRKVLYIEISESDESPAPAKINQDTPTLKDINFGFILKGTRIALKVDNDPSWEMEFKSPSSLMMRLIEASTALEKEKFGPVKRLKGINILKTKDKGIDLSLSLESPLMRASIFRMTSGDRLVLDIMDEPGAIPDGPAGSDISSASTAISTEDRRKADSVIEDKGSYLRMKINANDSVTAVPAKESPLDSVADAETGDILKDKAKLETDNAGTKGDEPVIDDAETKDADPEKGGEASADNGEPLQIEPRLDDTLPMSAGLKREIDGLSPDEAFLYGRIKQAMEIKDYEKGIVLTNQFLDESPDSSLVEDMMFLKGDFYYSIWKNGDNEVLGNIISSYQKAIDRFPESMYVDPGYIKMAQAQSSKGEEYLALGYLGLVLAQKNNTGLIPLAYLARGKIFLRLNQHEKALADFKAIIEQFKDSEYASEADFWIANCYHSAGQYEEAEKKLDEVLNMDPLIYIQHPEYLFLRAKNYLYLKDYDRAREYFFKALNIGRQQETADMLLTRIGDTYHNQEDEKSAEKYYRMVIDYYPGTEGASISKLRIAGYSSDTGILDELSTGNSNESISELALLEKGYQLYDKGQYAGVAETIRQLVGKTVETETRKSAKNLFSNAADMEMTRLYRGGKFKDMTDFYASIKGVPAGGLKTETMLNLALAYNRLDLNEEAVEVFKGIKLNDLPLQSRGDYYIGFAESYLDNGNIAEARGLLEKARNYDLPPADKPRISKTLALLYIEDNRPDDAYRLCQSVIDSEKLLAENELSDVYIMKAKILNMLKRYPEAEAAINSAPGMPDRIKGDSLISAYMELGKACYSMGDYARAIRSYENGFDLGYGTGNRDYWDLRFNLAQAYVSAGEDTKARTLLAEISENGDSILQQRAQLQIGTIDLEQQLQRLPLNRNQGD